MREFVHGDIVADSHLHRIAAIIEVVDGLVGVTKQDQRTGLSMQHLQSTQQASFSNLGEVW